MTGYRGGLAQRPQRSQAGWHSVVDLFLAALEEVDGLCYGEPMVSPMGALFAES
jgi:hypothetical protein